MDKLLILRNMKNQVKVVTDLAFDALDEDGSGGLDAEEIAVVMKDVAEKMGVNPPTDDDLEAILATLDENFDGQVDRDEFLSLFMLVIGKMLESEEELTVKNNNE